MEPLELAMFGEPQRVAEALGAFMLAATKRQINLDGAEHFNFTPETVHLTRPTGDVINQVTVHHTDSDARLPIRVKRASTPEEAVKRIQRLVNTFTVITDPDLVSDFDKSVVDFWSGDYAFMYTPDGFVVRKNVPGTTVRETIFKVFVAQRLYKPTYDIEYGQLTVNARADYFCDDYQCGDYRQMLRAVTDYLFEHGYTFEGLSVLTSSKVSNRITMMATKPTDVDGYYTTVGLQLNARCIDDVDLGLLVDILA
jgi:hypothetical protein